MLEKQWMYVEPENEEAPERKASWLELFYDLVYVATAIQLGNFLTEDVSVGGFIRFIALFIPIWWSWTGLMFYVNRFVIDDVVHRILVFTQIFAIASLAISIPGAFGDLYQQFVFAYVVIRLVLVALYIRSWLAVPEIRPLVNGYIVGFIVGAIVWFISAFVPEPINYVLWAVGLCIELGVPLLPNMVKWQAKFPPHIEHASERVGIFIIIVLGEAFIKVIDEIAGTSFDVELLIVGGFAFAVSFGMWWLYFDDIAGADVSATGVAPYVWIYSHLPITIGITAFGVAAKKLLTEPATEPLLDKYRLLTCVALIIFLFFVAIVDEVTHREEDDDTPDSAVRANWRFVSAGLIALLAVFGGSLSPIVFAGGLALIFIVQIAVDIYPKRMLVHKKMS